MCEESDVELPETVETTSAPNQPPAHVEYCTDEEELSRETEWIVQRYRKRKANKRHSSANETATSKHGNMSAPQEQRKKSAT